MTNAVELAPAARRHLQEDVTIRGYVSGRVYVHTLHDHVSPHGHRAVVVRPSGGWSQPERRSGAEFPLLYVDCWADVTRNPDGTRSADDNVPNAWAVYRAVDRLLQGVRDQRWGTIGSQAGLTIVSCERWSEPIPQVSGTGHAGPSTPLPYPVPLDEAAVVTAVYAIHTFH